MKVTIAELKVADVLTVQTSGSIGQDRELVRDHFTLKSAPGRSKRAPKRQR
jgi:hypothetical protein